MAGITNLWPVPPSAHQGLCGPQDISEGFFRTVIPKRFVLGGISVASNWVAILLGEFCCLYFMNKLAEGWWNWNCDGKPIIQEMTFQLK